MNKKRHTMLRTIIFIIGFTTITAQMIFIREILTRFHGIEISVGIVLALWLLWTALGSIIGGKIAKKRPVNMTGIGLLFLLMAVCLPATIVCIRLFHSLFLVVPGEMLGIGALVLSATLSLAPFCTLSGSLFPICGKVRQQDSNSGNGSALSFVYLVEVSGSGAGGLLAGIILVPILDNFEMSFVLAAVLYVSGWAVLLRTNSGKWRPLKIVGLLLLSLCFILLIPAQRDIHKKTWNGFETIKHYTSRFGLFTVAGNQQSISLFQDGARVATFPDEQSAEERVHYALLLHDTPQHVALVGGGFTGTIGECFKHAEVETVAYLEADPLLVELGRRYFCLPAGGDSVHIIESDARYHIKKMHHKYDVLLINMPEPYTAQINRFYTAEFYAEAKSALRKGGLLSFSISGSENYLSPALERLVQCLYQTINSVFTHVRVLPGATIHFFASDRPLAAFSADSLITRLKERRLETTYIQDYYLPFRFMPDRLEPVADLIDDLSGIPVNKDMRPIAFYYGLILWRSHFTESKIIADLFDEGFGGELYALMILSFAILLLVTGRRLFSIQKKHRLVSFSVLIMGLSVMSFQLFIMLGFQAWFGYLYYQLTVLIATFMMGMGIGTYTIRKKGKADKRELMRIHLVMGAIAVLLSAVFSAKPEFLTNAMAGAVFFALCALLCGFAGGFQFAAASHYYYSGATRAQNTGLLYGMDLFGGCLGALCLGSLMIPIAGFWSTALIIMLVNVMITGMMFFDL